MLDAILKDLPGIDHPDLPVGLSTADDAGVFRVSADVALIQTVDFFTPIVDDPYLYGQVAAANSLSDVYAMGGRPITALNICGFPSDEVNPEVVAEILRGGQDKVTEAGAVLVGGHTVEDVEPKYGLAVTGMVHPDRVVTNAGAQPGDRLVLTKPLGTGLISDAYKSGEISEEEMQPAAASMVRLNDAASAQMAAHGAHACTDITGFGLLGHGREMARGSGVGLRFWSSEIPYFDLAYRIAKKRQGGGLRRNRLTFDPFVRMAEEIPEAFRRLLFDPQTSGGLLIALPAEAAEALLLKLKVAGLETALVGETEAEHPGEIEVLP